MIADSCRWAGRGAVMRLICLYSAAWNTPGSRSRWLPPAALVRRPWLGARVGSLCRDRNEPSTIFTAAGS
jgi:hypothetical protein